MQFEVEQIIKEVRVALDRNNDSAPLIATDDIDTLTLDEIIESKIAEATRIVEVNAPTFLLEGGKDFANSVDWLGEVGKSSGRIHLPDDFLRLVSFKMSDWVRAVSVVITDDHPLYEMQSSRYPGIRGCPQDPIVAIVTQPIGQVLEFYSCDGGEDVYIQRARYIPIPKIEDGHIDICEKLRPAVVHYTAALVAQIIGQADLATSLINISNELQK